MNRHSFPARIELWILNDYDEWEMVQDYVVNQADGLYKKMVLLKSMYKIKRAYKIYIVLNSKVNYNIETSFP